MNSPENQQGRGAPLDLAPEVFRAAGHQLVDRIADHLADLDHSPVTPGETPDVVRAALGSQPLPERGQAAVSLLEESAEQLFGHSLFNGHPRFFGYITSSAAPLGALADLLAAAVNPNVGGWELSPIATEIEIQTVRWVAELIGYPASCGGLLVSGGNLANLTAFWAARKAKAPWDVRVEGVAAGSQQLRVYASDQTHTWIQKAADLSGLGTEAIRWIASDRHQRISLEALRRQIEQDRADGDLPFLVVGTAGTVSTGAVDPLPALADLCREWDLWFHVDGAYGAFAAALPQASPDLKGLSLADSLALDPHKWLYAPLEAGCVLVQDARTLREAFVYHPPYYPDTGKMDPQAPVYFLEYGPQNSRGFRALKVWLGLRQAGREGYQRMIAEDIDLARTLFQMVEQHAELEAVTHNLSITTFRYRPLGLAGEEEATERYLDSLNQAILERLQDSGRAYPSHARVDGRYVLRACIVNFRTTQDDIQALVEFVIQYGRKLHTQMQPQPE